MPSSMHVTQLSSFFNQLVELIPVKYYRSEDDSAPRINLQTLNKEQRLAAKQELKAKSKLNKKSKLSGDASGEAAQQPPSGATAASDAQQAPLLNISAEHVSRTELQQRLHQRLQAMQQQRKGSEKALKKEGVNKRQAAKQAKDWKQKTLESNVKAKQQQEQQHKQQQKQSPGSKRKADGESQPGEPAAKKAAQQPQEPVANFSFPRIELDGEGRHGNKGTKKPSKEALLKIAEAKQKEAAAVQGTKPKVTQETWKAAMLRASGEKVLDDPKLLRKSLKKEVKRKEKSAKGWEERKQQQQEHLQARQSKRKENLQARTQGRQDKKKARREKKLLKAGTTGGGGADAAKKAPRAGFEGRRSSFIGDKGGKGAK